MSSNYNVVGQLAQRSDGPDKVTGRGVYGLDRTLPDMLWCKFLRSPFAHAKIVNVDTSEAEALEGVHLVLTGKDVENVRHGRGTYKDEPVLCWDTVLYVGDRVAAVLADDPDIAEKALSLIDVQYEELIPVLSAKDAAEPGATILHPEFNQYLGVQDPPDVATNVLVNLQRDRGDVSAGFAEADIVLEHTYTTPHQHQAYLEPHSCLVDIGDDGEVQIWMSCQLPMANLGELARIMDIPEEKIQINTSYIGGSFGGKTDANGAYIAYLMAKETGRPIKFVMDYSEELMASNPRHPSEITIKAGIKKDGTITAWEANAYLAVGAYASYAPVPGGLRGVLEMGGPYKVDNVKLSVIQTYANLVPCGFARAPGMPQGLWAGESHMDACARAIGMDPYDFRIKNVIHDGEALMNDSSFQALRVEETITEAAKASGYFDPKPNNVGRGIAVGHHSQGGGAASASVIFGEDGDVSVEFSTFDTGGGTIALIAQVVAEELGIDMDKIEVSPFRNTSEGPLTGVGGSRGARVVTIAGYEAASDGKSQLRRLAAEFYGWNEESIDISSGQLTNTTNEEKIEISEIVKRFGEPVIGRSEINEPTSPYTSFGTHIAEVQVDTETGRFTVTKLTAVHETGTVINPVAFQGQVEGGIIYGFGEAIMTETAYDESGRVSNPSFADMKLPTAQDIPPLDTIILESDVGDGPYKVRGIGEHTNIMIAPAIANAIEDAVGARVRTLPITAEKVYEEFPNER
tara:strand:- start:18583 stop:20814 length:2232 start_codon:yes stop_codon:yes gene_type:complete